MVGGGWVFSKGPRVRNQNGEGQLAPLASFYLIVRLEMLCGDDCMRRIN